jgi:hypothetical protein
MEQRTLFDDPPPPPGGLQARFLAFHAANPHVFARFADAARRLKRQGRRRFGAKAIVEEMRWHTGVATEGDPYKLNNVWTSRYVRLLVSAYPGEFDGFLELRRLRAE